MFGWMWGLGLPIQGAFFKCVDVGDGEDACEAGHAPENDGVSWLTDEVDKADSPRIHEDDLDIKNNEEHGDEVEFNAEAWGSFTDGEHAALVGGFLGVVMSAFFTGEDTEAEGCAGEADGGEGLKDNGKVVS